MHKKLNNAKKWWQQQRYYLFAMLLTFAIPVAAMDLQQAMTALPQAKSQGIVGEQPNGYLGVVRSSPDADNIVRLINEARRNEYQRLARDNNIAITDIESMAGQKAIERTQRGHFILLDGQWFQKR